MHCCCCRCRPCSGISWCVCMEDLGSLCVGSVVGSNTRLMVVILTLWLGPTSTSALQLSLRGPSSASQHSGRGYCALALATCQEPSDATGVTGHPSPPWPLLTSLPLISLSHHQTPSVCLWPQWPPLLPLLRTPMRMALSFSANTTTSGGRRWQPQEAPRRQSCHQGRRKRLR